ncbi:hypothetical protein DDZ13_05565 [Coraliomargarita sinensis]|uniref:Uncharacterized protein n=2 Tax=Coraliomargarita sinensis TaxID=2174842 RepID=A0A317ZGS7_9BACT|nr:hypothetical protein DDZ13_05565 [Coraliomargarita sinensis]
MLLAAAVTLQGAVQDEINISLETVPQEVEAGEAFTMIWDVSSDDAQILEVFLDCGGAIGPEHEWEHDGSGDFRKSVEHREASPGIKEYELWAKLKKGEEYRFLGESFKVNVTPEGGDKELDDFLSWMKAVGYSEDVIQVYAHDGSNPVVRKYWDKYFAMREQDSDYRDLKTMPIVFIDLLATEEAAVNETLEGQAGKLEDYLSEMFGKAFDVQYEQQRVAYEAEFGEPLLQKNSRGQRWVKFNPRPLNRFARETAKRIIEERDLPPNSVIIRWAPKKWKYEGETLKVQDHTGSGPAFSGMDFGGYGIATYAHEWGHGLGLGHMFTIGPGSFASRAWGLECVMNHSYVGYSNREVGRLLSPLPRYALEPKGGYTDQKTFAAIYSEAMAGTDHLKRRLNEVGQPATAVSSMTWSTPWRATDVDSVICAGYKNRKMEVKEVELAPGVEAGVYTLFMDEKARRGPAVARRSFKGWPEGRFGPYCLADEGTPGEVVLTYFQGLLFT